MQVPRLFAVLFTMATFCLFQNDLDDFLLSFFVCWPNWRTKKAVRLFAVLLVTFWRPKLKKGRQKVMQLFLSSKRMPKRHQKVAELILSSNWSTTFFGRQKVAYAKRTAKSHGTCIQLKYKRVGCLLFHLLVYFTLSCLLHSMMM